MILQHTETFNISKPHCIWKYVSCLTSNTITILAVNNVTFLKILFKMRLVITLTIAGNRPNSLQFESQNIYLYTRQTCVYDKEDCQICFSMTSSHHSTCGLEFNVGQMHHRSFSVVNPHSFPVNNSHAWYMV